MPKLTGTKVPSYRLHRQSGQAIVTLAGRDHLLGAHGSAESQERYDRLIAEWITTGRRTTQSPQRVTVSEIIAGYWEHAQQYYRRGDGTQTDEVSSIRKAMKPLRSLYAASAAAEFGPLALKAVRDAMVRQGWCRTYVNSQIGRIRRMFKWAAENELVPASVHHGLITVSGLKAGRSAAREPDPVRPVSLEHVQAVLPFVSRPVRALIELQLLTGARGGELFIMRGCDIDQKGEVWVYRPSTHKTAHHAHTREIRLGPRAQELIRPFLRDDEQAFLFSPRAALAEMRAKRRAARKTPLSCGNVAGRKRTTRPKRAPGDHYDRSSYAHAIARACEKAGIPQWHPHQIRHTTGTYLRRQFGLEAAKVILGHRSLDMTQLYAEQDVQLADKVMAQVG